MSLSFASIFKKKKENFFIHIPKCGGSTFIGLLKDSTKLDRAAKNKATHVIDKVGNTTISHVDFSIRTRPFKRPDIFIDQNFNASSLNLFMLVREPAARLYSEFNFQYHILNGKKGNPNAAIISQLKPLPHTFENYIKFAATQNYQCKFLLGRPLADSKPVTEEEFQKLLECIDQHPIHCGVTDEYSKFLNLFQEISQLKLKASAKRRKQTPKIIKKELSQKTKDKVLKLNEYDLKLYQHVKSKIASLEKNIKISIEDQSEFIA